MATPDLDPEIANAPAVLERFKRALNWSMATVIALCLVYFLQGEVIDLRAFSIHPQDPHGLTRHPDCAPAARLGRAPGRHSLSVLILGTLAGTVFPRATLRALPLIWLGSGLGTWLIAAGGFHLGASGVTHGLGFLVFTLGILRRDRRRLPRR